MQLTLSLLLVPIGIKLLQLGRGRRSRAHRPVLVLLHFQPELDLLLIALLLQALDIEGAVSCVDDASDDASASRRCQQR